MTASASPPTTRASVVRASSASPARAATRSSASRAWTATASAAPRRRRRVRRVRRRRQRRRRHREVLRRGWTRVGSAASRGCSTHGVCDGTGETCPVWLEMSVVVPRTCGAGDDAVAAHLWEWAELALSLSGLPADASAAYLDERGARGPRPPRRARWRRRRRAAAAAAQPRACGRVPSPRTRRRRRPVPAAPTSTDAGVGSDDDGTRRRRLAQTATAYYGGCVSSSGAPGVRSTATARRAHFETWRSTSRRS